MYKIFSLSTFIYLINILYFLILSGCGGGGGGGGGGNENTPSSTSSRAVSSIAQPSSVSLSTSSLSSISISSLSSQVKVSLVVSTPIVEYGTPALLTWNAESATSCVASGGWTGPKPLSGEENIIIDKATSFAITCSGTGSQQSKEVSVEVLLAGSTIKSSTTHVIDGETAIISNDNTSIDFSTEPTLYGNSMTLQEVTSTEINELTSNEKNTLDTEFIPATFRIFGENIELQGDATLVSINVGDGLDNIAPNQMPVIYILTQSDDESDGGDGFMPQETFFDANTGIVSAAIQSYAFISDPTLHKVAYFKLGIANVEDLPETSSQKLNHQDKVFTKPTNKKNLKDFLGCPFLTECIETSMFNTKRRLSTSENANIGHFGTDFRAQNPTSIIPPAGGKIIMSSFTEKQYLDEKNKGVAECKTGGRAGIHLTLLYEAQKIAIKYSHLSSLSVGESAPVKNIDDLVFNESFVTDGITPIGKTGSTGAATSCNNTPAPHLHVELYKKSLKICTKPKGEAAPICKLAYTRVDMFPEIINKLEIEQFPTDPIVDGSNFLLGLKATDNKSIHISSAVGNAKELNNGSNLLDPTRKLCVQSVIPEDFLFSTSPELLHNAGIEQTYCAPWENMITVKTQKIPRPSANIKAFFSVMPNIEIAKDVLSEQLLGISDDISLRKRIVIPLPQTTSLGSGAFCSTVISNWNPMYLDPQADGIHYDVRLQDGHQEIIKIPSNITRSTTDNQRWDKWDLHFSESRMTGTIEWGAVGTGCQWKAEFSEDYTYP